VHLNTRQDTKPQVSFFCLILVSCTRTTASAALSSAWQKRTPNTITRYYRPLRVCAQNGNVRATQTLRGALTIQPLPT
jgi:hypothetical protein